MSLYVPHTLYLSLYASQPVLLLCMSQTLYMSLYVSQTVYLSYKSNLKRQQGGRKAGKEGVREGGI